MHANIFRERRRRFLRPQQRRGGYLDRRGQRGRRPCPPTVLRVHRLGFSQRHADKSQIFYNQLSLHCKGQEDEVLKPVLKDCFLFKGCAGLLLTPSWKSLVGDVANCCGWMRLASIDCCCSPLMASCVCSCRGTGLLFELFS